MPKFTVEFRGATFASVTVEAEDESGAADAAFADGFPELCAACSGWGKDWNLSVPDDPACWEFESVTPVEPAPGEG